MEVMEDDLIKTIEDDDTNVAHFSETDDSDEEAQPQKKINRKVRATDFDSDFQFVGTQTEYLEDRWKNADLNKYLKKKRRVNGTSSLDDKIKKIRDEKDVINISSDDDDRELSEDEMVFDDIKIKESEAQRKSRKRARLQTSSTVVGVKVEDENEEEETFFETDNSSNVELYSTFYSMNLSRPLLKAIEDMNFVHPTPIQRSTIPVALAGRDICGCAATGTGKTAAYMLPVLERLLYRPKEGTSGITRVVVLVPTRELGVQVFQVTKRLSQFTNVETALSVGGLDLKTQETELRRSPDIVIATPGRLIDHIENTPTFGLESVEVLILDEADRMLDECFVEQMKRIVKCCSPTRQTLLFSATMTDHVKDLTTVALKRPVKIFVDSNKVVAWNLRQEFVRIRANRESDRDAILASLLCRTFRDRVIVFIRTKVQCHKLHIVLGLLGIRVSELHGNMSQMQRLESLRRFREAEVDVLLTTDVAARGLDIPGVKTVINYELPLTLEHYIHRVGRTARAGKVGRSVSLAGENDRKMIREIVKNARDPVKSRAIPLDVVVKYKNKIESVKEDAKKIVLEEKAEREIANLENKTLQMQKRLNKETTDEERTWFQTPEERKKEKQKLKSKTKKQKQKRRAEEDEEQDPGIKKEMDFHKRIAKRSKKQNKIRTVMDDDDDGHNRNKKKRKSSAFDEELTKTNKKSVKKFRHMATSKRKEDVRNNKKKKFRH